LRAAGLWRKEQVMIRANVWWKVGAAASASLIFWCVGFAATVGDTRPVTFTKDVAPILQQRCQECHRSGSMAPMALITYEETRPWAKAIRERVVTKQMPPWHIDQNVGVQKFKNDMSLTDAQI